MAETVCKTQIQTEKIENFPNGTEKHPKESIKKQLAQEASDFWTSVTTIFQNGHCGPGSYFCILNFFYTKIITIQNYHRLEGC